MNYRVSGYIQISQTNLCKHTINEWDPVSQDMFKMESSNSLNISYIIFE